MDLEFKYVQGYNFKLIGIFGIGSGICNVILKMLKKTLYVYSSHYYIITTALALSHTKRTLPTLLCIGFK